MLRLAAQVADGGWPDQIALPTGAGKSEVALIWAWVREQDPRQPQRLWIASDRRVIVDQAFEGARALEGKGVLASRLRGGVALDTDAMLDLERPQVISCTIDQFGSRLLFRGYGVTPRSWPIHAALAGTDSLVVLDEAHLSPNAEAIFQACHELGADLRVVSMTATPRDGGAAFTLDAQDRAHPVLGPRLAARRLVEMRGSDTLASVALSFLQAGHRRIAMVANTVAAARAAFEETRRAAGAGGEAEVHLLIGRQRPIDRDRILEGLLPKLRSGAGEVERPVIVATTQAIEAGADLDFDAMISEGCPIDALIQRLGRLDRLGRLGVSRCVLLKPEKDAPPYGEAPAKAWGWLSEQACRHPKGGVAKAAADRSSGGGVRPRPGRLGRLARRSKRPFICRQRAGVRARGGHLARAGAGRNLSSSPCWSFPAGGSPRRLIRPRCSPNAWSCQRDVKAAADSGGSSLHGVELHLLVVGIEQPVKVGAARAHAACHLHLADALLLHGLGNLPSEHALDRVGVGVGRQALVLQEALEGGANVWVVGRHLSTSFCRVRARSRSGCGVFCVFFTKPCSRTMWPSLTQNMTRAMRPLVMALRTSHNPPPRGRHNGMPTGQAYSAVAMSRPKMRRSSDGKAFNQSRTGSVPLAER